MKFLLNYLKYKNLSEGSNCCGYVDAAIGTVGGESNKVDSLLCDLAEMCMQFIQIR